MSDKPMWSAIHHDRANDLIFVWYNDGTRTANKTKHKFYTPNRGEFGSYPSGMKDIYGKEMFEVVVDGKKEMEIKADNEGPYNHLSECDIDFRTRWLQNNYQDCDDIRFNMKDINICFLDIEVSTKGRFPVAEKAEFPVNCVTIYFSKFQQYYTLGLNREISEETTAKLEDNNCKYINCRTEQELLDTLFTMIGQNEVDILTGWNSDFFDIPYLVNRANKIDVDIKSLSRLPDKYKSVYVSKRDGSLKIAGTEVIDFLTLYKKYTFSERDDFKLDTIGFVEVGERKAPLPDGYMSYINHWDDFVWYNFKDVELMKQIEDKCRMFETTVAACSEARVPFSAIFEAKKMLVGFILNFLHKKGLVMPPLREHEREWFPGAYVYSTPNYYETLVSYDYRSMYPSIMMGANISPETKVTYPIDYQVPADELAKLVKSPWSANGKRQVFYRKDKAGIVPEVVKILFDGRTELKKSMKKANKDGNKDLADYYDMKQKTYKILGNSLYGLLGNPYFQLYDIDNSASVTAFGKELILSTIKELVEYIEDEFTDDPKFEAVFNYKPVVDKSLMGTFYNEDNELCYNRMSHGDTDSFFVKYDDIYKEYSQLKGKKVGVFVFKKSKLLGKREFDIEDELEAKKLFNSACNKNCPSWSDTAGDKKKQMFEDGIVFDGDIRVIYNRYCLTDFCRILDACLMEDKLAEIMQRYSDRWNYYENTLFLKREKCILQAIVTAKKKYICYVESNEDVKYSSPKFAITGMEIIRSSSTPFTRTHMLDLIKTMFESMDKGPVRSEYLKMKRMFFEHIENGEYYNISIPSGVKATPPKWDSPVMQNLETRKSVDWRLRAGSVWNYLIDNDPILREMPLEPIFENSKVKFVKVAPNQFGINSIAYVGNECPERLLEIFTPNWQEQWTKTFTQTMDKLFAAIGWGKNFENDERDKIVDLF